jgi:AraC-like DNA-binding protein
VWAFRREAELTTSATVLRLFVEALEALDVDWRALLRGCQIDPEQLQDPDAQIPQDRFEHVWAAAQEVTGDPCIGLHAGELIHAHAVNLFGYLMLSSATVGAGIERVARYQQVLTSMSWIQLDTESDPARLGIGAAEGSDESQMIQAEYVAGLIPRVMGWVSEADVVPEAASFRHAARGPLADYARVLRCDVEFGSERNELVFSAETLARPSRHADETVARLHAEFAERLLTTPGDKEVTHRVRRLLGESLESGAPSLASAARQLGMSPRSLQRRLSDEGTSFRDLLDGLRCEVAREHLERCHTPIAGVAHLAGFSDVTAFTRAATRWFGETPARLREQSERRRKSESDRQAS